MVLIKNGNMIEKIPYKHKIHNLSPFIVEIFDFITDEENEMFFNTIKHFDFVQSSVVGDLNKISIQNSNRTSSSIGLSLFISNFTEIFTQKISDLTNQPINLFQELEALKYEVGEKFKPHYDRYNNTDERVIGSRGQRIATNVLYLNDDYNGGELVFPKLKIEIKPKKNSLVHFNWNDDNWKYTIHGSKQIKTGTKYCMTCWIKEKPFGRYNGPKTINPNMEVLKIS